MIASVYALDDVGELLVTILRRLLHVPALRWVDDIFFLCRATVVEHALRCAVGLIRSILGESSVQDRKTASGNPLDVLGLSIRVHWHFNSGSLGHLIFRLFQIRLTCFTVGE